MNGGQDLIRRSKPEGLTHTSPAHRNRSCAMSVRRQTKEIDLIYRTPRHGRFFMNEITDKEIEDAIDQIRAKFEKRGNEVGLDILDSYEEQWDATGSLSYRQRGWLEKQLCQMTLSLTHGPLASASAHPSLCEEPAWRLNANRSLSMTDGIRARRPNPTPATASAQGRWAFRRWAFRRWAFRRWASRRRACRPTVARSSWYWNRVRSRARPAA